MHFSHLTIFLATDPISVGTDTGATTKQVLEQLGHSFASYTRTSIEPDSLESLATLFQSQAEKMIYKQLDIEKDISEQGLEESFYDIVIAPMALQKTASLQVALKNARVLLRPGGYLIMLESTSIARSQWEKDLKENGFSGI